MDDTRFQNVAEATKKRLFRMTMCGFMNDILAENPSEVDCKLCLRSSYWDGWVKWITKTRWLTDLPDVGKRASGLKLFDVYQHPDGVTRAKVRVETIPLSDSELRVFTDHMLHVGPWIGEDNG